MFRLAVVRPSANLIDKNAEKIKTQFMAAVKVLLFQPIPKAELYLTSIGQKSPDITNLQLNFSLTPFISKIKQTRKKCISFMK